MPPTVFPTGTTIYEPDKCWNGYTVYPSKTDTGAVLIDMNGNVVKSWSQFQGYPILLLPEGHVLGGVYSATRHPDSKTVPSRGNTARP
jgi:hypothetical protein